MSRALLAPLLAASLLAGGARLDAQQAPARPKLAAAADTNDWEAYFNLGVAQLRTRPTSAAAAFWWSSQLNPERAEPLFARWVAFWLQDYKRWTAFLRDDPRVRRDPAVLAGDSLPQAALRRNPFVHQGLAILLYDQLPGEWQGDRLTRGWLAYSKPDFPRALEHLGAALKREKKSRSWIRTTRAQCFLHLQQYDSAAAELAALESELAVREAQTLGSGYESKEMLAYATALLELARGRGAAGRAALERALTENLAFYPARDALGQLDMAAGDTAAAVREYELVAEVAPGDPVAHFHYGLALLSAGRISEAVGPLRHAIELAPWYASPRFALAHVLERRGERAAARDAYAAYLARAPRSDTDWIAAARSSITALEQ